MDDLSDGSAYTLLDRDQTSEMLIGGPRSSARSLRIIPTLSTSLANFDSKFTIHCQLKVS